MSDRRGAVEPLFIGTQHGRAKRAPSPAAVWQSHEQSRPLARLCGLLASLFDLALCTLFAADRCHEPLSSLIGRQPWVFCKCVRLWLPGGIVPDFLTGRVAASHPRDVTITARTFGAFRVKLCRSAEGARDWNPALACVTASMVSRIYSGPLPILSPHLAHGRNTNGASASKQTIRLS